MAFVNEYVSEKDINDYDLISLKNKYLRREHSYYKSWMKFHWCVDKERDIWFMYIFSPHLEDKREGYTGESYHILYFQGRTIEVVLRRGNDNSHISKLPYRVTWNLISINESDIKGLEREEVLETIRDALKAYGGLGVILEKYVGINDQDVNVNF